MNRILLVTIIFLGNFFLHTLIINVLEIIFTSGKVIWNWNFKDEKLRIPKHLIKARRKILLIYNLLEFSLIPILILWIIFLSILIFPLANTSAVIYILTIPIVLVIPRNHRINGGLIGHYIRIVKMNKNFKKYLDMYPNLTEQFYIDDISAIELSREFCEAASLFLEGKVKIVISPFKKLSINNINKRVAELKDANEIKKYIEDICFLNEEFSTLNKIPLTRHMMSYLRIILIKNSIN